MDGYLTSKRACEVYNVTATSLRRWDAAGSIDVIRTPTGQRRYAPPKHTVVSSNSADAVPKRNICYCRVSTNSQKDDLGRQTEFMRSRYPDHTVVQDVGSGINWKRPGLNSVLEQAMRGELGEVVVAHRDRLCRFAFELIESILKYNSVKLVVLDQDSQGPEAELTADLISIVHIFSHGQMGHRHHEKGSCGDETSPISPHLATAKGSQGMDGNESVYIQQSGSCS